MIKDRVLKHNFFIPMHIFFNRVKVPQKFANFKNDAKFRISIENRCLNTLWCAQEALLVHYFLKSIELPMETTEENCCTHYSVQGCTNECTADMTGLHVSGTISSWTPVLSPKHVTTGRICPMVLAPPPSWLPLL